MSYKNIIFIVLETSQLKILVILKVLIVIVKILIPCILLLVKQMDTLKKKIEINTYFLIPQMY